MKIAMLTMTLGLSILVGPALAQDGKPEEEKFDVAEAMRKVAELLRQSEKLLVESLKPRDGADEEAADAGEKAAKELEKLLEESRSSGDAAARKMMEILEKAPRSGGGGGGGQEEQKPDPKEDQKRKEQERKLGERDPQNSEKGKPESPREEKSPRKGDDRTKPPSETDKPAEPDPKKEWLAGLPPVIRERYENKDWGRIPRRWREYIEEYTRRLSELESTRRGE